MAIYGLLIKAITASETIRNAPLTDDATTEFTTQPKQAGVKFGQIAAGNTAKISGEERQPGEECDLLQVHAIGFGQV